MRLRLYGISLLGLSGVYWFFFYFLRNDLTVLAFGVYIILVRNFFFLYFPFFFFLLGEQKNDSYRGGCEGKVVGGGGEGG